MKLTINRNKFAPLLANAARAASTKNVVPIISNVLLSASGGMLRTSATDFSVYVQQETDCDVFEAGAVTVPAGLLNELVSTIKDDNISLSTEGKKLRVAWGRNKFDFNTVPPEEFPEKPVITGEAWDVDVDSFLDAFDRCAHAVAKEKARPFLLGVLVAVSDGELSIIASDTYRIAIAKVDAPGAPNMYSIIVPESLQMLKNLAGVGESVKVGASENVVGFFGERFSMTSQLMTGDYPDLRTMSFVEPVTSVTVSVDEMKLACKQAKIISNSGNSLVRMVVCEGKIRLAGEEFSVGEGEVYVDAEIEGSPDCQVALNVNYFLDFLSICRREKATFHIRGELLPITAFSDEAIDYTIMPLKVDW